VHWCTDSGYWCTVPSPEEANRSWGTMKGRCPVSPLGVAPPVASPSLRYFGERLGVPHLFQIHLEGKDNFLDAKVRVMAAGKFPAALP
jgi:hypothetical protein